MQTSNRLFDDFAKVASGAMNTLGGLREEVETRVRERLERVLADMDLVTREEFDAARAMAVKARAGQEELAERLARVEAELAAFKAGGGAGGLDPAPVDLAAAVGGTGPLVVDDIGAGDDRSADAPATETAEAAPAAPAAVKRGKRRNTGDVAP